MVIILWLLIIHLALSALAQILIFLRDDTKEKFIEDLDSVSEIGFRITKLLGCIMNVILISLIWGLL